MTASRPSIAPGIVQQREAVTGEMLRELGIELERDYPGTRIEDLMRYPVLSEGGWFIVVKNQRTLQSLSRTPWRLLGPITLLSEGLELG